MAGFPARYAEETSADGNHGSKDAAHPLGGPGRCLPQGYNKAVARRRPCSSFFGVKGFGMSTLLILGIFASLAIAVVALWFILQHTTYT
jgi:hypothetical protein